MGAIDSGNTAWILTSASLVFLMTPGVAFFYGGMVRAKAVLNMLMLEAAALSVTMIVWTLWGWSIAYAGSDIGGIFGDPASGFLLKDSMVAQDGVFTATGLNGNNYPVSVDVAFQVAFAMITVGLICGAIAERVKYSTWMIFVALWVTFDYAPMAHMVWNGGLLSADGAISKAIGAAAHDFAGGTVVHINAAVAALIIVLIIGKRKGFGTQPFRPHNVPFVMLGAFLLWFGWFGFNAGSAFAANGTAGYAWVSTSAATAAAMLSWGFTEKIRSGHYTAMGAASGMVAGLVAITPAADVVSPLWAIVMGAIAGVLTCLACGLKFKFGYDDSLDVVGVACLVIFRASSNQAGHYSSYGAYYYVHTGEAYNFHQEYLERVAILSGPEKDVQLPAYQFRPWFLCMGEISEDADNEANRSLAMWYHKDRVTLKEKD